MKSNRTASDVIMTDADWRVLDSLKVRNLQHLRGLNADLEKDIIREISDGINAGEGMPDLSARITEATNIAKTRADTIARTETINACIDGARQRYQQLGIEEVEVIACDDSRTCPICTTHDGKIYKLSDDANLPPYHPNCRCAIKAVVKKRDKKEELEKLKRRAEKGTRQSIPPQRAATPLEYKPAKTITEAEKLLESHGINTDYDGLAVEVANVTNKTIIETMDVAPRLRNTLRNMAATETRRPILNKDKNLIYQFLEMCVRRDNPTDSINEILSKTSAKLEKFMEDRLPFIRGALAYSDPFNVGGMDYRGVYLNTYRLSPEKLLQTLEEIIESERDGFFPKGCNTLKSIIDHELGHEIDRTYAISNDIEINKLFQAWEGLANNELRKNALSGYPTEYEDEFVRKKEFIADCWAEYRNNPTPRPTAKAVGDRMMKIIKIAENNKT